jgi:hypothetical protein
VETESFTAGLKKNLTDVVEIVGTWRGYLEDAELEINLLDAGPSNRLRYRVNVRDDRGTGLHLTTAAAMVDEATSLINWGAVKMSLAATARSFPK